MRKGISLVSLMITMVIMIAIISTVTISGIGTLNNNKKITFATEISMVQGGVDTYKTQNSGEYPVESTIELDISKVSEKSRFQFDGETQNNSKVTLYKINYSLLGITTLKYGAGKDENDMYVVSKDTGKVYYTKGVQVGGITYYTLTDDLKNIISSTDSQNTNKDGIIFSPSETQLTLDKVTTTVSVPTSFTDVVVSVLGSSNTYSPVLSGNSNVYTIDNIDGNYTITVSYKNSGAQNSAQYTIDNVDNVPPVFTADNIKENVVQSDEHTDIYLSLSGHQDYLSGIKTIKYAYVNMTDPDEISSYFKDNGLKVYNDVIEIEEVAKQITIYIEDKVGNFTAIVYEISDETYAKLLERDFVKDTNPTEIVNGITYTAYVPDGFYYVGGNVTTGVVISDNIQDRNKGTSFDIAATLKGNQFVWVPVNYIIGVQTLKTGVSSFANLRTGWVYNQDKSTITNIDVAFPEPYGDATAWEDLEYAEMLQSIAKYGGFYVARYEAGKDSEGNLVSKKDMNVWADIAWGTSMTDEGSDTAVHKSHSMYLDSESVVSHLIYGVQWDAIMYWANIEGKNASNSVAWGNYNDSTGDAANGKGVLRTTGYNDAWKSNNIYDIAGNCYEWTMESASNNLRVIRSGFHGNGNGNVGPASYRQTFEYSTVNYAISFRVALYLK